MILVKLHPKVPAKVNSAIGDEVQEAVRKVPRRVKVMTTYSTTEKVKSESRKLAIRGDLNCQAGQLGTSTIRIQIEEIKRKVRECSPSALSFIGPGDY